MFIQYFVFDDIFALYCYTQNNTFKNSIRENMGGSIPSFRQLIEIEILNWSEFMKNYHLRMKDKRLT